MVSVDISSTVELKAALAKEEKAIVELEKELAARRKRVDAIKALIDDKPATTKKAVAAPAGKKRAVKRKPGVKATAPKAAKVAKKPAKKSAKGTAWDRVAAALVGGKSLGIGELSKATGLEIKGLTTQIGRFAKAGRLSQSGDKGSYKYAMA